MGPVAVSIVALLAGAAFARGVGANRGWRDAADAFAIVAVGGLMVVHVLPRALDVGSLVAALAFITGLIAPVLAARLSVRDQGVSSATFVLLLLGTAIHGVLDGVGLASHEHTPATVSALAIGVVIHRFPVGIAAVTVAQPRLGTRRTLAWLATLFAATALGMESAQTTWLGSSSTALECANALVAGTLLHVLAHVGRRHTVHGRRSLVTPSGAAGVLALALVFALVITERGAEEASAVALFVDRLTALFVDSAAPLLFAFLIVGLIHALYGAATPRFDATWLKKPSLQALAGASFGLPFPLCSCSVVPLYRGLIARGVPLPAALAFLVAAPEIGAPAMLVSFALLGAELTLARVVAAFFLAFFVGWIVSRVRDTARQAVSQVTAVLPKAALADRLRRGLRLGFVETVDHTGPWIVLGLVVGALIEPLLDPTQLSTLPLFVDVPILALVGVPLYVCASGSTPFAAVLLAKGISSGAVVAFLLTGPATNLTTIGVLSRLHGKRLAATFAVSMFFFATLLGVLITFALGSDVGMLTAVVDDHAHSALEVVAALMVALLLLLSLLRLGVDGLLHQLIGDHEHVHDADGRCLDPDCDSHTKGPHVKAPFTRRARRVHVLERPIGDR
jgi:uncharacterized membrane protein YraQ (UPF0718 family)